MPEILDHFRGRPFTERQLMGLVKKRQPREPMLYEKPNGLWVSVRGEYDWPWWCKAESFRLEELKYRYRVVLKPGAKILRIQTIKELDAFTDTWTKPHSMHPNFDGIDWKGLAKIYDGIVIAPYQWDRRLNHHSRWYYGWDCASGCIWNPRAIEHIELDQ